MKWIWLTLICVLMAVGCGEGLNEGSRAIVKGGFLYFARETGEQGGKPGYESDLERQGKGVYLYGDTLASVEQTESRWVKVRIQSGGSDSAVGWVARSSIHVATEAELAKHLAENASEAKKRTEEDQLTKVRLEREAKERHDDETRADLKNLMDNAVKCDRENNPYLARKYFEDIVRRFPQTSEATAARQWLSQNN